MGGQQGINLIFLSTDELEDAVNRAINQGIYVVAAAGNDGGDNDDGDVSSPGSVEDVEFASEPLIQMAQCGEPVSG